MQFLEVCKIVYIYARTHMYALVFLNTYFYIYNQEKRMFNIIQGNVCK